MAKKITPPAELIKEFEKFTKNSRIPPRIRKEMRRALRECFETIPIPILTLKENDWIIASTPVMDLSAQGKTEEEAVKNLEAMINDYMTDPDTKKPEMMAIIGMEIGIKSIPMKLPIGKIEGVDVNPRKNPPIVAR